MNKINSLSLFLLISIIGLVIFGLFAGAIIFALKIIVLLAVLMAIIKLANVINRKK